MPRLTRASALLGLITMTTAALAHQNVQNPAVQARMDNMTAMARQMEVIGTMARGETAFDAEAANDALAQISSEANRIVDLFEAPETDPQSEARAGIWENFGNFSNRAMELELLAMELAGTVEDRSTLVQALRRVGASCSGCHEDYRINRD
ncbi:c-type cytochrome [Nioella sediminis]|jgi:cytochrome c556|uniref:c-type cytochrome n=1 Tax=Nioella sediminis TaxID=1912092 RepID=UPI0009F8087B|nr:cytochrome c [Nioella sediminis]